MAQTASSPNDSTASNLVHAVGSVIPAVTHAAEGLVLIRTMIRNRPACMGFLLFGVGYVLGRVVGLAQRDPDNEGGTSA